MVISIRVDRDTARILSNLARARGGSKTAVVADALRLLAEREASSSSEPDGLAGIEHVVGIVSIGGRLSERTGEKVRAALRRKSSLRAR